MNIYDVLRRLVEARQFQDYERTEALKLLEDLEAMNVLGTVARNTQEGHQHDWFDFTTGAVPVRWADGQWTPPVKTFWRKCRICSLEEAVR